MFNNLIQKFVKEKRKGKLVVGICSTHPNAGATHFSMLLATYFSEWLGQKTAYVNFKDKVELTNLKDYFLKDNPVNDSHFRVGRVTFYSNDNLSRLSDIIGEETDCLVLDMGHQLSKNQKEFLRCDIKIVISSLAIWQQNKLELFLETTKESFNKAGLRYVIPFIEEKDLKKGFRKHRIHLYQMPYQPDPFTINTTVVHFFDRILQK